MQDLKSLIRTIPDFPEPGVLYRDITPLLRSADGLRSATEALVMPWRGQGIACVAGMEARGFLFGALAAQLLDVGFVPLRKPGKLPHTVEREDYALEYGTASLEMHRDALEPGERVLIVDDVLATGGTAAAAVALVQRCRAEVLGCAFVIELGALRGRARLPGVTVSSVLMY
ncbi:MAG TPA: adenine phosphoribosyltransferase [Gammaproteobacteria bacterium]|nr:adenine phosphoribosyltransferase [Gammaproteobacteria bacterium]